MATKTTRGKVAVKRPEVLLALRAQRNLTRHDLGISASYIAHLIDKGLIEKSDSKVFHVNDEGETLRGRPLHTYKLSRKGSAQALRLAKAQEAVAV